MNELKNKFEWAQDAVPKLRQDAWGGFNQRICEDALDSRNDAQTRAGWNLADDMIRGGKIFYVHNFHRSHSSCNGSAFQYGGSWVCNSCGNSGVDKPWWKIKVRKDGNAWHCIGEGFENIQESENHAFGDTRKEAIENYGNRMVDLDNEKKEPVKKKKSAPVWKERTIKENTPYCPECKKQLALAEGTARTLYHFKCSCGYKY